MSYSSTDFLDNEDVECRMYDIEVGPRGRALSVVVFFVSIRGMTYLRLGLRSWVDHSCQLWAKPDQTCYSCHLGPKRLGYHLVIV